MPQESQVRFRPNGGQRGLINGIRTGGRPSQVSDLTLTLAAGFVCLCPPYSGTPVHLWMDVQEETSCQGNWGCPPALLLFPQEWGTKGGFILTLRLRPA